MLMIEFQNPETGIWDSPMWWVASPSEAYCLAREIGNGRKYRLVEVEVLRVFDP